MWGKNEKELNVPKEIAELAQDKYEHNDLNISDSEEGYSNNNISETKKEDNTTSGLKDTEDKILSEKEKKKIFLDVSTEKLYKDKAERENDKERTHKKASIIEEFKERIPEVREPEPISKVQSKHRRILPFYTKEHTKNYADYIRDYTGKQQRRDFQDELSYINESKESPLSFFDNLSQFFRKEDINEESTDKLKKLLDDDILQQMKSFHIGGWDDEEIPFSLEKESLKRAMQKKLSELRNLEERWYNIKERLVNEKHMLEKEESQINFKLDELKSMIKKLVDKKEKESKIKELVQKEASEEGYFILRSKNNVEGILKSIDDLKEKLPSIADEVFNYHVNENRNDFADWIENIFHAAETASKLRLLKTKKEFIEFFS